MKFSECFYQISFIVEVNAVKVRFTHFSCRQNVYFSFYHTFLDETTTKILLYCDASLCKDDERRGKGMILLSFQCRCKGRVEKMFLVPNGRLDHKAEVRTRRLQRAERIG